MAKYMCDVNRLVIGTHFLIIIIKVTPFSLFPLTFFKKMALEMRENGIRFSLRLIEEIALALKEK
jgi:hypothetical protein